ncbi:MAG: hypothetical protein RMM28_05665, partial [Thermoleophilia bacterium]|nr:hypothetical protein [Thermoleophilia bacterium]
MQLCTALGSFEEFHVRAVERRMASGGFAMFVIAGASGKTGKVVAETLLSQGKKVRVVVRDGAKGSALR